MRSKDGSLPAVESGALLRALEDVPQTMRRRSLTEARHTS